MAKRFARAKYADHYVNMSRKYIWDLKAGFNVGYPRAIMSFMALGIMRELCVVVLVVSNTVNSLVVHDLMKICAPIATPVL